MANEPIAHQQADRLLKRLSLLRLDIDKINGECQAKITGAQAEAARRLKRKIKTQSALYKRVVGKTPRTDEEKALASWYWRNLNYAHGEDGKQDIWGRGFKHGQNWTRDYWTGLFAHGFGLCGTSHSQYSAEMNALLGHVRGRAVGVSGHNSFEVFLRGGAYGDGKWVLLDHDISTVIYGEDSSQVRRLREFRDRRLATTGPGRASIVLYYRAGPAVARLLSRWPSLRGLSRAAVDAVLRFVVR